VPYRGPVAKTVQEIMGGVRSTCTYTGAKKIKQLPKCATFIRCSQTHNSVYEGSTIGK
jgi:GMP reductase